MDQRLGRISWWDPRNMLFPIRPTLPAKQRSMTWLCPSYLDQGNTGSCVGHSVAHDAISRPHVNQGVTQPDAMAIYHRAQQLDPWPGAEPDYEGTSVLAGLKAGVEKGWFTSYRWALTLEDIILGIGYHGPAILGVNWYGGMFSSDADGLIRISGGIAGGHALLCKGVSIPKRKFRLHNSWGKSWGLNGDAFISFDDMERLLGESGEVAFTSPGI